MLLAIALSCIIISLVNRFDLSGELLRVLLLHLQFYVPPTDGQVAALQEGPTTGKPAKSKQKKKQKQQKQQQKQQQPGNTGLTLNTGVLTQTLLNECFGKGDLPSIILLTRVLALGIVALTTVVFAQIWGLFFAQASANVLDGYANVMLAATILLNSFWTMELLWSKTYNTRITAFAGVFFFLLALTTLSSESLMGLLDVKLSADDYTKFIKQLSSVVTATGIELAEDVFHVPQLLFNILLALTVSMQSALLVMPILREMQVFSFVQDNADSPLLLGSTPAVIAANTNEKESPVLKVATQVYQALTTICVQLLPFQHLFVALLWLVPLTVEPLEEFVDMNSLRVGLLLAFTSLKLLSSRRIVQDNLSYSVARVHSSVGGKPLTKKLGQAIRVLLNVEFYNVPGAFVQSLVPACNLLLMTFMFKNRLNVNFFVQPEAGAAPVHYAFMDHALSFCVWWHLASSVFLSMLSLLYVRKTQTHYGVSRKLGVVE